MIRKRISLLSLIALVVAFAFNIVKLRIEASRAPAAQPLKPASAQGVAARCARPGLFG